jgi:hypothetical protein
MIKMKEKMKERKDKKIKKSGEKIRMRKKEE